MKRLILAAALVAASGCATQGYVDRGDAAVAEDAAAADLRNAQISDNLMSSIDSLGQLVASDRAEVKQALRHLANAVDERLKALEEVSHPPARRR